jgi:hypothetical protein
MIEDASREFQFDGDRPVAPPSKVDESTRTSVIPMQSSMGNPTMTFAAAAGADLDRRQDANTIRVPPPSAKVPVILTPNYRDVDTHIKAVPSRPAETFSTKGRETTNRPNSPAHRPANVGQIIAELSAGAAASAPVLVNRARAKNSSNLAKASIRASISWLVKATAFLLAFVAENTAALGRQTRDVSFSLRSNCRRWFSHGVALASPVFKRITAPFISWLKEPRPPTLLVRANLRTRREPSSRFSAVSNNLRGRAEPIVRWLQTPLRSAQRR